MKKDTSGKSAALIKQLAFKRSLGLTESSLHRGKAYEVILADDDASLGAAFYCYKKDKEWEGLQKWANEDKGKKVNFLGNGLKNLYRSEHIPFNVFYPLAKLKDQNDNKLNNLVELICGVKPDKVTHIKVEYSGDKKREEYLGDRTSFDAYLQFESENKTIGLGFEVKYTEKSYPFKSKEKRDLHDKNSQYMIVAKESGYYKDYDSGKLKSKELKQLFRNHLLGIKMQQIGEIDQFFSVHFYPSQNVYQADVAREYKDELKEIYKGSFIDLTFERFIKLLFEAGIEGEWVDYFKKRY